MAADTNAGHVGATWTPGNKDNLAVADQKDYDPSSVSSSIPGDAARKNGYPRES